jgi:hypothetical protein
VLGPLLQLAALRFRSEKFKELEIVVLRHELAALGRQAGRPELKPADRVFLWVSKLRSRHGESRFAGRTQILKPHRSRRAATPSALLHPDEACSRSKIAAGSTQTELSAPQAGFAKYIFPNPVIASALALRAASASSSAGAAS